MINIDSQYSHNTDKRLDTLKRKCTMCHKYHLIELPEEFQVHSRTRNYVSYFCCNCIQIVNFMLAAE